MDPATAALAAKGATALIGGIFGGDALSSATGATAADSVFNNAGGRASTGGEEIAPRWIPLALLGLGLVALVLVWRK